MVNTPGHVFLVTSVSPSGKNGDKGLPFTNDGPSHSKKIPAGGALTRCRAPSFKTKTSFKRTEKQRQCASQAAMSVDKYVTKPNSMRSVQPSDDTGGDGRPPRAPLPGLRLGASELGLGLRR